MFKFVKHWFTPHSGNNHRAKILHNVSLSAIIILLVVISFSANLVKATHPEVLGVSYSISETDLSAEVNAKRQENGLAPLTMNAELADAARRKAADMLAKNYWAHFAPDGSTTPWQFIRSAGYDYQFAGENLAKGFTDSGSIVNAWMNSPTHRENLLSSHYHDVGYAIVPGVLQGEDTVLVVQMFGETPDEALARVPNVTTEAITSENAAPAVPQVAEITPQAEVKSLTSEKNPAPIVDSKSASKVLLSVVLSFLILGLILDALIVERKKIPRFVGHNLDHVMLILTFILFLIVMRGGVII